MLFLKGNIVADYFLIEFLDCFSEKKIKYLIIPFIKDFIGSIFQIQGQTKFILYF